MTVQSEKPGRICREFAVPTGYTVHYQHSGDIYHSWNTEKCCHFAGLSGGHSNIVTFTPQYGNFGFCECIGWTPGSGAVGCAGQATADAMICPVEGGSGYMCPDSTTTPPACCGAAATLASTKAGILLRKGKLQTRMVQ